MFDLLIAIAHVCMWLCIWALSRNAKRQQQEIRELKRYFKYIWNDQED